MKNSSVESIVRCGSPPQIVGYQDLEISEFMYFLYLPVSMKGSDTVHLPERLQFIRPLISTINKDYDCTSRYIYATVKSMFVGDTSPGNRPGWHIDGFQSGGDINYIWYDANPTEFAVQQFHNIPNKDEESIIEITKQVDPKRVRQYPERTLLKLDESVVHRVSPNVKSCFRTFIKITVSKHRFTNKGNSRNYLIPYNWAPKDRATEKRNLDHE